MDLSLIQILETAMPKVRTYWKYPHSGGAKRNFNSWLRRRLYTAVILREAYNLLNNLQHKCFVSFLIGRTYTRRRILLYQYVLVSNIFV